MLSLDMERVVLFFFANTPLIGVLILAVASSANRNGNSSDDLPVCGRQRIIYGWFLIDDSRCWYALDKVYK